MDKHEDPNKYSEIADVNVYAENLSLCFPLSVWIEEFEYIIINYFIAYAHYDINNIMLYIMLHRSKQYL